MLIIEETRYEIYRNFIDHLCNFFYKPKTSLKIKFTVYKKGRDNKEKNKKDCP